MTLFLDTLKNMQKYDFQQLLRQQRETKFQGIKTIFYAVILGIIANIFFKHLTDATSKAWIYAIIVLSALVVYWLVYIVLSIRKSLTVRKQQIKVIILMDEKSENPAPIQIWDYEASISAQHNWNKVVLNNPDLKQKYIEARDSHQHYHENWDYKLFTDLIQYMILLKISATSFRPPGPYLPTSKLQRYFPTTLYLWALRIIRNLLYKHKEELNKRVALYLERIIHLNERNGAKKLSEWLIGGRQVTDLPEAIQQNIFLQYIHASTPFNWKPPFGTKLVKEMSDESFLPKMVLKNKIGRVSILIKEHRGIGVQEAFIYATRFSNDLHRDYREVVFTVTVEVLVNNFAAIFRGKKSEEFFEWADKLTSLIETLDWDRFQRTFSRDLFYDTYDRLDGLRKEILVEFYENFDDTPEGKVLRLLRLTRSPHWKPTHDALKELIKIKEEVPQTLIETVTLRLMALTSHHNETVAFKAAEALNQFNEKIPVNFHESIIERLLKLLEKRYKSALGLRVGNVIEALTAFYNRVGHSLQRHVFEAIIRVYLEIDALYRATREALTQIWSRTPPTIIEEYLERYQSYLASEDMSLVLRSLRFYSGLGKVLEPYIINEVIERVLNQEAYSEDVAIVFCTFTRDWDAILPEEYSDGILAKLIDFIEHQSQKVKKQCLRTIGYAKRTYSNSSPEIQENIVRLLISHINQNNETFQRLAAESLSFLIETVPETLYDEVVVYLLVCYQLFRDKSLPEFFPVEEALQFLSNRISDVELSGMIETCLTE